MAILPAGPIVPAPEPLRRRYGLLTAAAGPLDLPARGEGGGLRYVPLTCGTARGYGINCYDGQVASPAKPLDTVPDTVEALPFLALATVACNAVGWTEEEYRQFARRRLASGEQGAVEQAFWNGLDFEDNPLEISTLSENAETITIHDDLDMIHIVAALEDYAYREQGYGYAAYIHAPVIASAYAAEANLIVQDGPIQRTPYGSVWVFGGGYPGTGAAGAAPPAGGTYLHITGQTTVWRSPEESVYSAFDRETNQRMVVAERAYAVAYDCFNGRALFDPLGGVS
jgi:hypothetical protein